MEGTPPHESVSMWAGDVSKKVETFQHTGFRGVLAGSGHWVQEEHSAQVNATLLTFLQGL
jgi:pimeloyl-ACP methyl ester carboxylesterase